MSRFIIRYELIEFTHTNCGNWSQAFREEKREYYLFSPAQVYSRTLGSVRHV